MREEGVEIGVMTNEPLLNGLISNIAVSTPFAPISKPELTTRMGAAGEALRRQEKIIRTSKLYSAAGIQSAIVVQILETVAPARYPSITRHNFVYVRNGYAQVDRVR